VAGIGHIWGTADELLHPRDRHGRFRKKWKMAPGVAKRILGFLDSFSPRMFQNDAQAAQHLFNAPHTRFEGHDVTRLHMDYDQAQEHLRSGDMDESTKKFVDMMDRHKVQLKDDLILSRTVGPEAFGLTPQQMAAEDGGLEDFTGKLIADRGYGAAHIGGILGGQQPGNGKITMRMAVPKGTSVIIPARNRDDRGIFLDRDQELRITKVQPDGAGGYYVLAVATPRTKGETPTPVSPSPRGVELTPAQREARIAERGLGYAHPPSEMREIEAADKRAQVAQQAQQKLDEERLNAERMGTPGADLRDRRLEPVEPVPQTSEQLPQGVEPRNEPISAPSQAPAPAAPAEPVPTPGVPTPDQFRTAVRDARLPAPSVGSRRREWNEAYLGIASGRKDPGDALRELETDIRVNKEELDGNLRNGRVDNQLEGDISAQEKLADLIREQYGIPRVEPAAPAAPTPVKKAATRAKKAVSSEGGTKAAGLTPDQRQAVKDRVATLKAEGRFNPDLDEHKRLQSLVDQMTPAKKAVKAPAAKAPVAKAAPSTPAPAKAMRVGEARRQTALDAARAAPSTFQDHDRTRRQIIKNLDDGTWTPTRARQEAVKEAKRLRSPGQEGSRGQQGARNQAADMYEKLAEDLLISQSVTKTDKYTRAPAKETPAKAVKETTPVKAAPEAELSTELNVRAVQLDNRVRAAYRDLRKPGEWVGLADLREHPQLRDLTRAEQDQALAGIIGFGDAYDSKRGNVVRLIPIANRKALTDRDRAAAVQVGGEDQHAILFDDPSPRPLSKAPGKKVPGKKTVAPEAPAQTPMPKNSKVQVGDRVEWTDTNGEKIQGTVGRDRRTYVDWDSGRREYINAAKLKGGISPIGQERPLEKNTVPELRKIASGEGVTLKSKMLKADIVKAIQEHRATPTAPAKKAVPEVPSAEVATGGRQREIDSARKVADAASEIDEILNNGADTDSIRRTITNTAKRLGIPNETRDRWLAEADNPARLAQVADEVAAAAGLTPVGKAGEVLTFDRKKHQPLPGSKVPAGARVEVVRRGYTLRRGGEDVALSRPLVQEAAPEAPAPTSTTDILDRISSFDNPPSREEAHQMLSGLTRPQLLGMAKTLSIPGAGGLSREKLRNEIVEGTVGRRLDSIAIRGFRGVRPELPETPAGAAALKRVPAGSVPGPRAQVPVSTPERRGDFKEAWSAADIQAKGSAGRTLTEIRDDVSTGKITPEEGVRRLETDISLNKEELADIDATLRGDLPASERRKLIQQAEDLESGIEAQEKASGFMRDHFKAEAPVTRKELLKLELPTEVHDAIAKATPDDLKDEAVRQGLNRPQGDTADEVIQDIARQVAGQELERRAAKAAKAAKKAAPPDLPKERGKLDARVLAEGLGIEDWDRTGDHSYLGDVQRALDGEAVGGLPKNATPAAIGRWLQGMADRHRSTAAITYGGWRAESDAGMPPEIVASRVAAREENERIKNKMYAEADALSELGKRLQATRRPPVKKAAPAKRVAPQVKAAEARADSAENRILQTALDRLQAAKSDQQAREALSSLTMPELRELGRQHGVTGRSKESIIKGLVDRHINPTESLSSTGWQSIKDQVEDLPPGQNGARQVGNLVSDLSLEDLRKWADSLGIPGRVNTKSSLIQALVAHYADIPDENDEE